MQMGKVYALLVAIDSYPGSVSPLKGCVNDIESFSDYLDLRAKSGHFELAQIKLLNGDATRSNVIDGFRNHLSQAKQNDVALFYFCGHGSQESSPPEFWHLEPDHLNETLVCWDSREFGGWDLADKELGQLISEVATADPHVLIIVDACHAGTVSRESLACRQVDLAIRDRPADTFIFSISSLNAFDQSNDSVAGNGWLMPNSGRHVLIAACRDDQTAKEILIDGKHHGAFSSSLLQSLQQARRGLTYRELVRNVSAQVRLRVRGQHPQLQTINSSDRNQEFLGVSTGGDSSLLVKFSSERGWILDAGQIHGIRQRGKEVRVDLYPYDAHKAELRDTKPVATGVIEEFGPSKCTIAIDGSMMDRDHTFKAVVRESLVTATSLHVSDEETKSALAAAISDKPEIRLAEHQEEAEYAVEKRENSRYYLLARARNYEPIAQFQSKVSLTTEIIQILEHLAQWQAIASLTNPCSSFPESALTISVHHHGRELSESDSVRYSGKYRAEVTIILENHSQEYLYCALFCLNSQFAISTLLETDTVRLAPGELIALKRYTSVDKTLINADILQTSDLIKVIACTDDFDSAPLELSRLDVGLRSASRSGLRQLTRRFMKSVFRDIGFKNDDSFIYEDWFTKSFWLTTRYEPEHAILGESK